MTPTICVILTAARNKYRIMHANDGHWPWSGLRISGRKRPGRFKAPAEAANQMYLLLKLHDLCRSVEVRSLREILISEVSMKGINKSLIQLTHSPSSEENRPRKRGKFSRLQRKSVPRHTWQIQRPVTKARMTLLSHSPPLKLIEGDCENNHRADDDLLKERGDSQQVTPIAEKTHDERPDDRPRDRTLPTVQAAAPNHDRRNDTQFIPLTRGGLPVTSLAASIIPAHPVKAPPNHRSRGCISRWVSLNSAPPRSYCLWHSCTVPTLCSSE